MHRSRTRAAAALFALLLVPACSSGAATDDIDDTDGALGRGLHPSDAGATHHSGGTPAPPPTAGPTATPTAPTPAAPTTPAAPATPAAAPAVTGSLVGLAGKCLDANAGGTANGTVVQLYACNGSAAQRWTLVNGQITGPGGQCLDVTGGSSALGTRLQLWSCSGEANQQWSLHDGVVTGLAGNCLDVTGNSSTDGTPVQMWSCSGADNQTFVMGQPLPHFYGGNAHWDYDWTAQELADHLHQTNMTTVRFDTGGYDEGHVARIHDFAVALAAIDPALELFVSITGDFDATLDEAANYAAAYAGASSVVATLGAVGVTDFECGNERPSDPRVFPDQTVAGDVVAQYTAGAPWQALRGTIRGMVDAVKSASPSNRAAVNFTIAQIAASDMLWNGTESDGSSGHPTVRWDLTSWHNYEVYGSLFHLGTNGHGSDFDVMGYVAKAYGRPILITEWNADPEDDDATKTAFSATWLADMYAHRAIDGIESTMIYQLAGGAPDFGLFAFPGQTAEVTSFTATHLAL